MSSKNTNKTRSRSLKKSLSTTFIVTVIIPFTLLLIVFSLLISIKTRSINISNYNNTLSVLSSSLDSELSTIGDFANNYENELNIRTFFYYFYLHGNEMSTAEALTYKDFLYQYALAVNSSLKLSSDYIVGVGFVPINKDRPLLFYHEKGKTFSPTIEFDESEASRYNLQNAILDMKRYYYDYASYLEEPAYTLNFTKTIWNNSRVTPIGFLKIDISTDLLYDLISNINLNASSTIFVKHLDSNFVASSNKNLNFNEAIQVGDNTFKYKNRLYHVESHRDSLGAFEFYYFTSIGSLYAGLYKDVLLLFLAYFLLLIIAFFGFFRFSNGLTNSLIPISETLKSYKGGKKVPKISSRQFRIKEIESLALLTDNMIEEVESHIDSEYKSRLEQKKAEFRALQAEINPHFLYNTLNSLVALNRIGETKLLEDSFISLSRLFRYTCENTRDGLTTIKEEFMFLENYLKLQKLRYDDRLKYNITIDPDTENYKCPKLMLQPLVENAIVHGFEPSDHPVTIHVSSLHFVTKGIGDVILLSVTNDGVPLDEEADKKNKRVGLKNVEARLHAFWPKSAFIKKGGPGKNTEFHIIMADAPSDQRS